MAQEQPATPPPPHVIIVRGADDQLAGLERLWTSGESSDPQADEAAWQILSHALNESRRAEGARLLFKDE